jgi:hypothetical protein
MADVTINSLPNLTPSTGLFLPVTDGSSTGKVTLSQVCGVMTSTQITTALGYIPYNSTNPNNYISSSNAGVAKAWAVVSVTSTETTILKSYNVSSVNASYTENTYLTLTVNFTNPMTDENFATLISSNFGNIPPDSVVIHHQVLKPTSPSQVTISFVYSPRRSTSNYISIVVYN